MHLDDLSDNDRAEVERFTIYLRAVGQAKRAGCTAAEATRAIYPDVYDDEIEAPRDRRKDGAR